MQPTRTITYLRLSVTDQCDLGCVYCVPYRRSLSCENSPLSVREVVVLVTALAENGIAKVRLTGGEPLVRDDILELVGSVARIPGIETVGLTTNAVRLSELAAGLADAGLKRVNISLDSLDRETFRTITGRDCLDNVLRGLHSALEAGFEQVKVNTVVMRGINDSEICRFRDLAGALPVEVRFIELMPLGHTAERWAELFVPAAEIRRELGGLEPLVCDGGASAKTYLLPDGRGKVGIISPMSEHFCDECNRVRVTSSGKLKPCLRLSVQEDVRGWLGEPRLTQRLRTLMEKLSCCKLSGDLPHDASVQSETMCAVGG